MTDDDESDLPVPHPGFVARFTDPLYEDEGEELAPFGSDEGWDLVREWGERRDELSADATVQEVLDESPFPEAVAHLGDPDERVPGPLGGVDAATYVIASGFTLLRLTGRIDHEGRAATLRALDALARHMGPRPEIDLMRKDLLAVVPSP